MLEGQRLKKIHKIPVDGSEPKLFMTLPFEKLFFEQENRSAAVTMTPDGKSIICSVRETISDAWLIENFDPEVK